MGEGINRQTHHLSLDERFQSVLNPRFLVLHEPHLTKGAFANDFHGLVIVRTLPPPKHAYVLCFLLAQICARSLFRPFANIWPLTELLVGNNPDIDVLVMALILRTTSPSVPLVPLLGPVHTILEERVCEL